MFVGTNTIAKADEKSNEKYNEKANEKPAYLFMEMGFQGNNITPIKNGDDLNEKRLELIGSAKRSIYLSTFSISHDRIGKDIVSALCRKAKDGLEVRMIIDHRANIDFFDTSLKLKDCGAVVIHYRPGDRWYAIHEKLLIVDGEKLIMGGSGYTSTYGIARYESYTEEYQKLENIKHGWYDIDYLVEGMAACSFHYQFQQNFKKMAMAVMDYNPDIWWYGWDNFLEIREKYYKLKKLSACSKSNQELRVGTMKALPLLGNPMLTKRRPILDAHLAAIEKSIQKAKALRLEGKEEKVKINLYGPYFVPGPKFSQALGKAAEAGVQVRIITNSLRSTDEGEMKKILFAGMVYSMEKALKKGVEIYLWNEKATLHRKGGVMGDYAFFGSDNLDNRAQEYQAESVLYTDDNSIVADVNQDFERDLGHSIKLTPEVIKEVFSKTSWLNKWIARNFKKYF